MCSKSSQQGRCWVFGPRGAQFWRHSPWWGSGQSPQKLKKHCMTLSKRILCVTHGVKELSTRSLDVELRQRSVCSDVDATQLNSTSSCRHVHSVNNCHLSMNVVTQLTQFVGHDVINKNTTDLAVCCSTGSVGFKLFS